MKKTILFIFAMMLSSLVFAKADDLRLPDAFSALMPMPNKAVLTKGTPFVVNQKTTIYASGADLSFSVVYLQNILSDRLNVTPAKSSVQLPKNQIKLLIDNSVSNPEGYVLNVNSKLIEVKASTKAGILNAVSTLDQVLLGDVCNTKNCKIVAMTIDDYPRFARRALMLDPARHFLPVEDVKKYIDTMMRYKYNVLQIHLTDDQGWRFEVKGEESLTAHGKHYTQEQLKDIISYAEERGVEIVPEIDIPGHTSALLFAKPHLGCTSKDTIAIKLGKTADRMLCASNAEGYELYKKIISQISSVFKSKYIHLGGDESIIEQNWAKCSKCQAMMKELGYSKPEKLMIPFFEKMLSYVRDNGKTPILWCENDNIRMPAKEYLFPYPQDVVLVTWRYGLTPLCLDLTYNSGNKILMAPGEFTYFDYPQLRGDLPEFNNWGMPVTTLKRSYEFDPGYGLPKEKQQHIDGVMGTLWGEAIQNIDRANYMTYPRAFAMIEAGWTEMENRSWESFKKRIYPNILQLMKRGVSVRAPFEIANEKK